MSRWQWSSAPRASSSASQYSQPWPLASISAGSVTGGSKSAGTTERAFGTRFRRAAV